MKRDLWQIKAEILEACKEPQTLTDILLKKKLLGGYYIKYVHELVKKGMLQVEGTGRIGKKYTTTQKGLEWLKLYSQLKRLEGAQA